MVVAADPASASISKYLRPIVFMISDGMHMANSKFSSPSSRIRFIGLTTVAVGAVLATGACSSSSGSGDTTPSSTPTTAAPTTAAPTTAAPTTPSVAGIPAPPAGSVKLSGGDTYSRYKKSGTTPLAVTNFYKAELAKAGYTIVKQNSGGGGYGPYGGSGSGLRAQKGNEWAGVGAGAEKGAPTYFSVCVANSESGINRCDGENDQNENHSNSNSS